jgi:MCP family monocarboxylic acid transporter-like MFS transporter 13/MCP family monocarboxylic acid transporter-like MFS transporter 12
VLTVVGAGTTLLAPMLLDPVAFGAFALLSTLFQYTAAADLGLAPDAGALAVSAMGLAGAAGRLSMGAFADSCGGAGGRARLCTACLAAAGLAVLALAAAPQLRADATYLCAACAFLGFFSGSVVSQVPPLLAELVGLDRLGPALGLVYTTQAPTVLLGPPMAGAMRAALGSYVGVWLCMGALMTLSPLVMVKLPVFRAK